MLSDHPGDWKPWWQGHTGLRLPATLRPPHNAKTQWVYVTTRSIPSAHTWPGTEVPSVAQTLLLPRIFSQYLWVWLICPVQALEGTLLPRNILNLIFLCMEWNSLCSPLEAVFHLVPPGDTGKAFSETFRQQALSFSPFSSISVNACRLDWV